MGEKLITHLGLDYYEVDKIENDIYCAGKVPDYRYNKWKS